MFGTKLLLRRQTSKVSVSVTEELYRLVKQQGTSLSLLEGVALLIMDLLLDV